MIAIEPIGPGAHQILVYGEITAEDVARFVAFAEQHAGGGGSVLVDMVSMARFSWSALAAELGHVPVLLRWLHGLERIALVADEAWIRTAARLESALLPGIAYEVYDADEAEAARAFVLGESTRPHEGAVRALDVGADVVAVELTGRLDRAEAEHALDLVRAQLAASGARRLMVVVRRWHGFDADATLSGKVMQGKRDLLGALDRYTVVGGPGWLRQVTGALGPLFTPEIRSFDAGEEDAALAWLRG